MQASPTAIHVSYARRDERTVKPIVDVLIRRGLDVAGFEIDDIDSEVAKLGQRDGPLPVAFVSSAALQSEYCQLEWAAAANRQQGFVILLEKIPVPEPLAGFLAYPFHEATRKTTDANLNRLADAIESWLKDEAVPVQQAGAADEAADAEPPTSETAQDKTAATDEPAPQDSDKSGTSVREALAAPLLLLAVGLFLLANYLNRDVLVFESDGRSIVELGTELVVIPAGSFDMGSPDVMGFDTDERPAHTVTIDAEFAIGKFEVTFAQYREFADNYPTIPVAEYPWPLPTEPVSPEYVQKQGDPAQAPTEAPTRSPIDRLPVINVSVDDARAYAGWLNSQSDGTYRLPTEAEWEYVARANTDQPAPGNANEVDVCDYANIWSASVDMAQTFDDTDRFDCDDGFPRLAAVGSFAANNFYVYDTIGNVAEWTKDCYAPDYSSTPTDGSDHSEFGCDYRVYRGGSWMSGPRVARVAFRSFAEPGYRDFNLGFRVVRELDWLDKFMLQRPDFVNWASTLRMLPIALYVLAALSFLMIGWLNRGPSLATRTARRAAAEVNDRVASGPLDAAAPDQSNPSGFSESTKAGASSQGEPAESTEQGNDVARPRSSPWPRLIDRMDKRLVPTPGLFRVHVDEAGARLADRPGGFATRPQIPSAVLVLVHGFASNTMATFRDLWNQDLPELDDPQGKASGTPTGDIFNTIFGTGSESTASFELSRDQVFAFEHRTSAPSIAESALALARQLPENIPVHCLAFDTGGLVVELLCRANRPDSEPPFTAAELEAVSRAGATHDRAILEQLNELLARKHIDIRRVVRVASPIRGNPVAANIGEMAAQSLERLPWLLETLLRPVTWLLWPLMRLLWKQLAQASVGLRSGEPGSPVVALINESPEVAGDVYAVAANTTHTAGGAKDFFRRRVVAVAGGNNDLVVPVAATLGGLPRTSSSISQYALLDETYVDHFSFFTHQPSRSLIAEALAGAPDSPLWRNQQPDRPA